ncbi:MAG: HD domain-containing protein [Clostridia bacterium]
MTAENNKLKQLAQLFAPSATLYAVGGYVRDTLLGIECGDIDVCSKLTVDEVKTVLLNTDFDVLDRNLRVGTVIIKSQNFTAEYTTFRQDSYPLSSGHHKPCEVLFTDDIKADSLRRDFKMNAIYLNPLDGSYTDLLNGIDDIKRKIISTTDLPSLVFAVDGLRILRLVRFAAELGFEIEENTFLAAKENVDKIKDIVPERIAEELNKIFVADTAHIELKNSDGHKRGIELLDRLGLIDILLPELANLRGLAQPKKYHLYDAYRHSIEAFNASNQSVRWPALLHDIGKVIAVADHGNMHDHAVLGATAARFRLNELKFPKATINHIVRLIENHMIDINGSMSESKLKWFIAENADIIEDLCLLKDADMIASAGELNAPNRLKEVYNQMLVSGAPMSIKQLKVDGHDLVALGVSENDRGRVMHDLWRETVLNETLDTRDKALEYLKRVVEKQ